ncbi:hypothetical protein FB451DRAFT_1262689, partial [Mycena latifolia]
PLTRSLYPHLLHLYLFADTTLLVPDAITSTHHPVVRRGPLSRSFYDHMLGPNMISQKGPRASVRRFSAEQVCTRGI